MNMSTALVDIFFEFKGKAQDKATHAGTVWPQHSMPMSLHADFICSWKHIHAKSRRTVDIKIMQDFHFFLWSDIL